MTDTLTEIKDRNIRTIKFIGKTHDGLYTKQRTFELNQHPDMEVNRLECKKVITMNGNIDILVELDTKGRLLSVQVERNEDYVATSPFETR